MKTCPPDWHLLREPAIANELREGLGEEWAPALLTLLRKAVWQWQYYGATPGEKDEASLKRRLAAHGQALHQVWVGRLSSEDIGRLADELYQLPAEGQEQAMLALGRADVSASLDGLSEWYEDVGARVRALEEILELVGREMKRPGGRPPEQLRTAFAGRIIGTLKASGFPARRERRVLRLLLEAAGFVVPKDLDDVLSEARSIAGRTGATTS